MLGECEGSQEQRVSRHPLTTVFPATTEDRRSAELGGGPVQCNTVFLMHLVFALIGFKSS